MKINPLKVGAVAAIATTTAISSYLIHKYHHQGSEHLYKPTVTLLGDIGGTNIRLQLVVIQPPHDHPQKVIKKETYPVKNYASLLAALREFLCQVPQPEVAVLAIAGPISDNSLRMANVPKWGLIEGDFLGYELDIPHFKFINDFEANAYGLLVVPEKEFVSVWKGDLQSEKTVGVMGPGTGLGNCILYTTPFRKRTRTYVLPSEGGHTDMPYIDDETVEFFHFMKDKGGFPYISLERSFCGPAIPYMFAFFASKFPEDEATKQPDQSSQHIITQCLQQPQSILYQNVLRLLLKIYKAAMGNFIAQHMCVGGLCLVGSLTKSLLPILKGTNVLKEFCERHSELQATIESVSIVYCLEQDLGLKGAFVVGRRIISDEQHE